MAVATTDLADPAPCWTLTAIIAVLQDGAIPPLVTSRTTIMVFLIVVGNYLPPILMLACKGIFLSKSPIERKEEGG